ncbi:MAG: hypothetical protein KF734_02110 [Saprospiraceae bacterium]|nr:hypothetical protein [Saprospiraceae bacterium]
MKIPEIIDQFRVEFHPHDSKFVVFDLTVEEAQKANSEYIWKPGVYVWFAQNEVVKVGRSFSNTRKRALEHINYGGKGTAHGYWSIQELAKSPGTKILFFNLKDEKDKHWAAALEIFFETLLKPKISSGRLG